jgi:uncharacterized protein (TIGR03545 family)
MSKEVTLKKKKKSGPIRFEAIIPIAIIMALVWGYSVFFLDRQVKWALEYGASMAHGAEVNIASLNISFTAPSLTIRGIEVTDKTEPSRNVFSIGKIHFGLLWDALLRAKVVVSAAEMTEIGVHSKRRRPGKVYPPKPKPVQEGPSLGETVAAELKDDVKKQMEGTVLQDIAGILEGSDPMDQLKGLIDELQSEKKIKEIETALKTKEQEWKKRIDSMPNAADIQQIAKKVQDTKIDQSNPQAAAQQIKGLQSEFKRAEDIVKDFDRSQKELRTDVGGFDATIKQIEDSIRKDIDDLQGKLSIPKLDTESLTRTLFAKLMGDKLQQVAGYVDMAQAYIPAKKEGQAEEKKPEFVPHPRGSGRSYTFPITVSYPLFWLQRAAISSTSANSESSGDFSGELKDLSSNAAHIDRPMTLDVSGDAPHQSMSGIKLNLTLDQRSDENWNDLVIQVASHPFENQQFSQSPDVKLNLLADHASSAVNAKFKGKEVDIKIKQTLPQVQFETDAKSPILKEALQKITQRIKSVFVEVRLRGNMLAPKITLASNLGDELAKGFKEHLNAKIAEARAKIKQVVDGKVKVEKDKLMAEFNKIQSSYNSILNDKDSSMKAQVAEVKKIIDGKSKIDRKDIENKAKDALKKFKF